MNPHPSSERRLIVRHLWAVLRPHRQRLAVVMLLVLLTSVMEGASYSLLIPLTQVLSADPTGRAMEAGGLPVYRERLAGYPVEQQLAILGLALVALFGLKSVVQYGRELLSTRLWLGIGGEVRERLLASVLQRPYRYYLDHKQGALVQQLYHEPQHVAYVVQIGIEQGANLFAIVVLFGLLVLVSWQVTLFVLTVGSLYGLAIWRLSKRTHRGGEERQQVEGEILALLTETVGGIRQVKVFKAEARVRELYGCLVRRLRDLLAHHWLTALLPQRVTELFWVVVLGLLLCLPSLGVIGDVRSVLPVAAVFSAVAFRMGPYMSRISQSWQTVRFYLPALQLVGQLSVEPQEGGPRHGVRRFASIGREISFEDVNFSYGHGRFALSHVSVRFARGEVTAVIGPSGSGKSTLVDLLARLYDPTTGRIAVDGIDLAEYDAASWLATIGFVSQDTFIFHGTIRENIALARPGASAIQVQEAAMLANAHDFILRCPQGYETIVGDRGLKLSGGERQRIAIARALVRDPQVLIFDEATSALDNQSEALVQEAMASIARDRTVIIIAHRLSAVVGADKIVVLENGWVVEEGTHATLVKAGGVYSALYGKELT